MDTKIIHIKIPNGFFDIDTSGRVNMIQGLVNKIESYGEPGQYCCMATPFDITCVNDEEALLTINTLFETMFLNEYLRDGLISLIDKIKEKIDNDK